MKKKNEKNLITFCNDFENGKNVHLWTLLADTKWGYNFKNVIGSEN
jgi:hypothetical protein